MSLFMCVHFPILFPIYPPTTLAVWQKIRFFSNQIITSYILMNWRRSWSNIYSTALSRPTQVSEIQRTQDLHLTLGAQKPFAKLQTWAVSPGSHLQGLPDERGQQNQITVGPKHHTGIREVETGRMREKQIADRGGGHLHPWKEKAD